MSRSLNPTRPVSSLLIFDWDARMTLPASSSEIRAASRSLRRYAPSRMRSTVGLPVADDAGTLGAGPVTGLTVVTIASPALADGNGLTPQSPTPGGHDAISATVI